MKHQSRPTFTGNLDASLTEKFQVAGELFEKQDMVMIHIKGTGITAHNRDPETKMDFLKRFDKELGHFLDTREAHLRIVITSDHSTSSITGSNQNNPVPVVLWGK